MKIAIIGTGNVGGALATQWSKTGHLNLVEFEWFAHRAVTNDFSEFEEFVK